MNDSQPRQLSLAVHLNDETTFDNFLSIGSASTQVTAFLRHWSRTPKIEDLFVFLGGNSGSGKSHLMQACCHEASQYTHTVQYLPLTDLLDFEPVQLLENMEYNSLVCIDDVHVIAGNTAWEEALFTFYNRVRELEHKLLVSGNSAPNFLPVSLPDLRSRLSWGPVFNTVDLTDEQKISVLCFRAQKRGFTMNDDVARFLVSRAERDMASLISLLERLDQQSLEQQRMLTIPFVKKLFDL